MAAYQHRAYDIGYAALELIEFSHAAHMSHKHIVVQTYGSIDVIICYMRELSVVYVNFHIVNAARYIAYASDNHLITISKLSTPCSIANDIKTRIHMNFHSHYGTG